MTDKRSSRRTPIIAAAVLMVVLVAGLVVLRPSGRSDDGRQAGDAQPDAQGYYTLVSGQVQKIRVTEGDTVKFQVTSPVDEELHVHGYDRAVELPAGKQERLSLKADLAGVFEVELENAGKQLAELTVEPG